VAEQGDESFIILQIQAPPTGEGQCAFTPDRTAGFISRGIADLNAPVYTAAPLFESRIVAPAGRESLRTIALQGANISLEVTEATVIDRQTREETTVGAPFTVQHQQLFSASLPPNGGLAVANVDLIDFRTMADIQAMTLEVKDSRDVDVLLQVVATMTVFGDYYGERLDTTPFQFPVTLTNTQRVVLGTCPLPEQFPVPEVDNACSALQDTSVFCCSNDDGTLACAPPTIALCGNGLCEDTAGEDSETCAVDCPVVP
jgi:hypothetical protein